MYVLRYHYRPAQIGYIMEIWHINIFLTVQRFVSRLGFPVGVQGSAGIVRFVTGDAVDVLIISLYLFIDLTVCGRKQGKISQHENLRQVNVKG